VPVPHEIARNVIVSFQQPFKVTAEVEKLRSSKGKILESPDRGPANREIAGRLGLSIGRVRRGTL